MTSLARLLTRTIDRFYFPLIRRLLPLQTFRYAMCGGMNVLFSWVLYYMVLHFLVAEREIDVGVFVFSAHVATQMIVFPIVTLTGFLLNRYVAFKNSPLRGRTQLMRYLLSTLGSWALNVLLLKLFADAIGIWATPSFIFATLIGIVYSYLMQKYFTFRGADEV